MLSVEIFVIGTAPLIDEVGASSLREVKEGLVSLGYFPQRINFLNPEMELLIRELRRAEEENQLVIILAEMGSEPTDSGKQLAAFITDSPFILDRSLGEQLKKRFKELEEPELYALRPEKARLLEQWVTPCSALFFESPKAHFFFFPYSPKEAAKALVKEALLPHLKERFLYERLFTGRRFAWGLSSKEQEAIKEEMAERFPLITFKAFLEGKRTLFLFALPGKPDQESLQSMEEAAAALARRLGPRFIDDLGGSLAASLHRKLLKLEKKLMVAESCTGGALAAALVKNPDASRYFEGGIIAYSNALKESLLNVKTIEEFGAVSRETAEAMVEGLFTNFPVDLAVAVTGIAGPTGGSFDKPVGDVWISVGVRGSDSVTKRFHFQGERESVIQQATEEALFLLLEVVF